MPEAYEEVVSRRQTPIPVDETGRDQLLYGVCYETRYLDLRKKFPRFLFPQWHIS